MSRTVIDPKKYHIKKGESWWIVHPNSRSKFILPHNAMTLCIEDFLDFKKSVVYSIFQDENFLGWVNVRQGGNTYSMPEYVFARYFDPAPFIESNHSFYSPQSSAPSLYEAEISFKG